MIYYKTSAEVELIRESSLLVSKTLAHVASVIKPGMTTIQIDELAETFIRDHGAVPSFKNYKGFPFTCCISVNDAVVHGFPNDRPLRDGDIVSVDVGAYKNGFHGDSAYTFALGTITDEVSQLLEVTKTSLYLGIEKAVAGNRVGDISFAIQEYAEKKFKYGVVRELVGHGLGRHLHEEPQVPNYGKRGSGAKLKDGLVIAIEPMINMGVKEVWYEEDGWTVKTKDGLPAAHFEHTICVRRGKADILSNFEDIEAAEKANPNLFTKN
ncbi:type I methionyl aminopeptidase [Flavihumibacter cheonanensis]|jgi:methionyl aminopeptidase|uniref:type I methionyl aminopeptidase n=1 Tax=Flavihumibacter cheonanensis TaxID=1442385 RepID=UPI001EF936D1|nr:type I methionyl aminopeptidase [Flavihumibacter cheonanensis]MCG7751025.1 type I methionyl aminopeptidase [Flavihumibacter cheonanensis]